MATTAEIDAAMTRLRSARVLLAQLGNDRALAVLQRDAATARVVEITTKFQDQRTEVNNAKAALQTLLAQAET